MTDFLKEKWSNFQNFSGGPYRDRRQLPTVKFPQSKNDEEQYDDGEKNSKFDFHEIRKKLKIFFEKFRHLCLFRTFFLKNPATFFLRLYGICRFSKAGLFIQTF